MLASGFSSPCSMLASESEGTSSTRAPSLSTGEAGGTQFGHFGPAAPSTMLRPIIVRAAASGARCAAAPNPQRPQPKWLRENFDACDEGGSRRRATTRRRGGTSN
eukprot:2672265-Pyramimonas_sp.AAC.2